MNLDKLEPPPPDACFAVTNVMGEPVESANGVTKLDARAVFWAWDDEHERHRHWWCRYHSHDIVIPEVEPTFRTRRVRIDFENGWSASIVYGDATYSSNRDRHPVDGTHRFSETPTTVEVMVIDHEDRHANPDGEPFGWQTPREVIDMLDLVVKLPTDYPFAGHIESVRNAGGGA
jgi:hypothetical protein